MDSLEGCTVHGPSSRVLSQPTDGLSRQKIVDALTKVISNQAVLPHRFSVPCQPGRVQTLGFEQLIYMVLEPKNHCWTQDLTLLKQYLAI